MKRLRNLQKNGLALIDLYSFIVLRWNYTPAAMHGCIFIFKSLYLALRKILKDMALKTIVALFGALPCTIAVNLLQYVYRDWEFAKWIFIAVVVDTVVSLVKHWIIKDLSSEEFWSKFSKKIFVYICLLITSNLLNNYTVNGHVVGSTQWIGEYMCTAMLLREVFSIVENGCAIMPVLPKSFLKRLKDFNEKGEYINKKKEE